MLYVIARTENGEPLSVDRGDTPDQAVDHYLDFLRGEFPGVTFVFSRNGSDREFHLVASDGERKAPLDVDVFPIDEADTVQQLMIRIGGMDAPHLIG